MQKSVITFCKTYFLQISFSMYLSCKFIYAWVNSLFMYEHIKRNISKFIFGLLIVWPSILFHLSYFVLTIDLKVWVMSVYNFTYFLDFFKQEIWFVFRKDNLFPHSFKNLTFSVSLLWSEMKIQDLVLTDNKTESFLMLFFF